MSRRVTSPGWFAARVLLTVAVLMLGVLAAPALATEAPEGAAPEEEGPAPSVEEIGTQNEVSQQYLPEEAEPPPFMRFLYVPLVIVGFLMAGVLLLQYLRWQPRFAEERRSKRRR